MPRFAGRSSPIGHIPSSPLNSWKSYWLLPRASLGDATFALKRNPQRLPRLRQGNFDHDTRRQGVDEALIDVDLRVPMTVLVLGGPLARRSPLWVSMSRPRLGPLAHHEPARRVLLRVYPHRFRRYACTPEVPSWRYVSEITNILSLAGCP